MWSRFFFIIVSLVMILPGLTMPVYAFYEWKGDSSSGDIRGLLRGYGIVARNPEEQFFYQNKSERGLAAVGRLMIQSRLSNKLSVEVNAYQTSIPRVFVSSQNSVNTPRDVERSSLLEWSLSDNRYTELAFDRMNLRWSSDRFDVTLGRQPINFATTYYFSPNDLFAPFAAQIFFRVYKPGVDAVRTEFHLDELSQLSFFHVFGYQQDQFSDTGWSNNVDTERASDLIRTSSVYGDFEWTLLGGRIRRNKLLGLSLQGEFNRWLGIRLEGHILDPKDRAQKRRSEWTLGLEHRWENSLDFRMEYFYHGAGADKVQQYSLLSIQENILYFARRYITVGASYEMTALLLTEAVLINNLVDQSRLLAINGVYSLSDESELALSLSLPVGEKPEGFSVKSEFGNYPRTLLIEVRQYF